MKRWDMMHALIHKKIFQEKEMLELGVEQQWGNYMAWNKPKNLAWGFMLFKFKI